MKYKEKLMNLLQEIENSKKGSPFNSGLSTHIDLKMGRLIMNLIPINFYSAIRELELLLNEFNDSIIICALPITRVNGQIYSMNKNLTVDEIKELIIKGKQIIIYSIDYSDNTDDDDFDIEKIDLDDAKFNPKIKYRCAVME